MKTALVCVPRLLAKSGDAGKIKSGSASVASTRSRLSNVANDRKIAAGKTAFRASLNRSATPFSLYINNDQKSNAFPNDRSPVLSRRQLF
ncbi:MAG: hypothetical protein IIW01_09160 [Thermoguttaceae bacterium]|nr:hypothetical protein [Thermoguttaceae bacterium]MBQ5790445.1 hypothetical protein [Thermoguttaceae bacterium]